MTTHRGSCLCGKVSFEVEGGLMPVDACHCSRCRKWTGHIHVGTGAKRRDVTIHGSAHLRWHTASEKARRGFCAECGSSLFFDPLDKKKHDWIGLAMGAFDTPTGLTIARHIFTADKGDYYEILDGAPQHPE